MDLKQQKALHKAIKQSRIEIDGQVWYIDLPGAPVHALGPLAASKRGKRRAKGKSRTGKRQYVQICKKAFHDPWDVEKYKRSKIRWVPNLIPITSDRYVARRITPGLIDVPDPVVVQPRMPFIDPFDLPIWKALVPGETRTAEELGQAFKDKYFKKKE